MITILGELPEISAFRLEVEPDWPGIGAHCHDDQVDAFFVLDGEARFVRGDEAVAGSGRIVPGRAARRAHGVVHEGGRVVLLNVHGPDAGFAESIRRL